MPSEDVVHVLRNVHRAVAPGGLVLDIHPLGFDLPVRAGDRGVGFVDVRRFAEILVTMDGAVAAAIDDGLFADLRTLRRHVVERFDTAEELLEHADEWENLRLPAAVRRRLRRAPGPVELMDSVLYRLLRRL